MVRVSSIITYDNFNNPVQNEIPCKDILLIVIYVSLCGEYGWVTFADHDKVHIGIRPPIGITSGIYIIEKENDVNDWMNWKPTGQFEYAAIERLYWARDRKL